jgi:prolyl-tRNA synthetase
MKLSQLVGKRIKEVPRDAVAVSHQYLLRGGYVRPVAAGIYSILPLAKRVLAKIEGVIRDEMNKIGGQEVLMPVVMPRELWEESGRYQSVDQIMVRFKDRNQKDMVLGLTHEEAVLGLARTEVSSYKQFPFMLYQIQTKFRDELRPRSGLIRVREFTMKDAYSFHRTQEDLVQFYDECYGAYERVFKRVGLKSVRVVQSDTGMMGGAVAHEFMLDAAIGEDSLVLCDGCGYSANAEVAICKHSQHDGSMPELKEVATPNSKTIDQLCEYLGISPAETAKAVFFRAMHEHGKKTLVFCLVRGDKEINEIKLSKILGGATYLIATEEDIRAVGAEPGYASPVGLKNQDDLIVLVDESLSTGNTFVTGANKVGSHYQNFCVKRDISVAYKVVDLSSVISGDACINCQGRLRLSRGVEIGNIFQLGMKYTESMKMSYLDEAGVSRTPLMGCYGIGVGRLMASIIEDSHDQRGPIWPWQVAPYQIHICTLDANDLSVMARAESLYRELLSKGFDVLWDDTNGQAGAQFADADLIGAPIRLVVSPRNEKRGVIELTHRDGSLKAELGFSEVVQHCVETRRNSESAR